MWFEFMYSTFEMVWLQGFIVNIAEKLLHLFCTLVDRTFDTHVQVVTQWFFSGYDNEEIIYYPLTLQIERETVNIEIKL